MKKTSKSRTATEDTGARLETARAALARAREEQQAAQLEARTWGDLTSQSMLAAAERKARLARAELELDEASMAHRDALLAAEVEAGDEDARQVAGVVAAVAERADDVAALRVRLAEAEAALRGVVADARAAWGRVAQRRQAAGQPTPREPNAHLAAAVSIVRAHSAPIDHRQLDAVARALCGGLASVPAEHIPGATCADKLEALFEGRHLDEGIRRSRQTQLSRLDLEVDRLRETVFEAEQRERREAAEQAEAVRAHKQARQAAAKQAAAEHAKAAEAEQKAREARKAEIDAHFAEAPCAT